MFELVTLLVEPCRYYKVRVFASGAPEGSTFWVAGAKGFEFFGPWAPEGKSFWVWVPEGSCF